MFFRSALALGLLAACLAQNTPRPLPTDAPPDVVTEAKATQKPATYWITYSKTVRPGHPMIFQVHIFKGTLPVDMNIVLRDANGNEVLRHGPVSVVPMVSSSITVDIPQDIKKPSEDRWYWQRYNVDVYGRNTEISIKTKGEATYQEKAFSIFVQTDKAMYKPSQKVQFRTLAMTPGMKVMRDVKQDIVVFDPKGNRILQYRGVNATDKLGVVEKSFRLGSSVPIGMWKIKVTIQGVDEEKEFEVSEYVLPRFEVKVDGSSYGLSTDLLYDFTVRATYTFGKPVTEGKVLVHIDVENYSNNENKPVMKRGQLDKNGELKVQVTLEELKTLIPRYHHRIPSWMNFEIKADVTEGRTRKTHSGTHIVNLYDTPMKMSFLGITPTAFKSGLDYTAYIEVKKQDDTLFSPLELKDMSVMINVTYNVPQTETTTTTTTTTSTTTTARPFRPNPVKPITGTGLDTIEISHDIGRPGGGGYYPKTVEMELDLGKHTYKIPETGWIVVTFRVPNAATSLRLRAASISPFKEVDITKHVSKSRSPTNSFLKLDVLAKKPRVGDIVKVQAKATDTMKMLTYQVISKDMLVASGQVSGPAANLGFQFQATVAMSPSMSIVAFYVRDDGEFVVDALSLSVDGLFDNAVSAEFSKEKVQPGEPVNLIVKGEADSVVFLLVIDKSVKLLKSGNDITQEMVREELASYDYGNYGHWRYMYVCGWPSYFGGEDARSVIDNTGIVVMTDGLIYSRYDDEDFRFPMLPDELPENENMPNVGGSIPTSKVSKNAERTRTFFPENWLWNFETIDAQGEAVIPLTSPDTITSWLASAFSVNEYTGLSVAAEPAEVITFRNMFISLDLPSSIVRGEDFCFPASVFSYYAGEIPVILTLDKSSDFSNIWAKKENGEIILNHVQMHYSYFMGFMNENEVKTVTFCFTPTTIGHIPIKVSALTDVDGLSDAVERKLRVKPEGVPHATTLSYLVTPENGVWTQTIPVQFPTDTVLGSERISVNIAGNLLGSVFDNLDDLLKKPYGCGEQNMINFSPIMSLVDFFFTTNTITEEFRQKAVDYMLIGYQKEILYEHGDTGGYSTFGNHDQTKEKPSMWLTAFVTKCFSQAEVLDMKYQDILAMDLDLIYRSAQWMVAGGGNQQRNGSFVEHGRVFNKGLQGGSSEGVALTSYTVIALHNALKVLKDNPDYDTLTIEYGMSNAVTFLESSQKTLTDPYDICITTYALVLVGSQSSTASFDMMEKIAKKGYGMTYWEREKQKETPTYYWSRNTDAINIEMTAYALLTYSLLGRSTTDGLPVLRWLSKQKGPNGGFISTQDTVIGIEALTSVAKDLYGAQFVPMTVTVNTRDTEGNQGSNEFRVTKDNEMLLQRNEIPYQSGSQIEISATTPTNSDASKSTVLVDVVFNYNVQSETTPQKYGMDHQIRTHSNGFDLNIKIYTTDGTFASMSILEVDIPAGYEPDWDTIDKRNKDFISQVDTKEDRINIYINTDVIGGKGIKIHVPMTRNGGTLTKAMGKNYKVYDYYESENELSKLYYLAEEGDFCSKMPEFGICQYQ